MRGKRGIISLIMGTIMILNMLSLIATARVSVSPGIVYVGDFGGGNYTCIQPAMNDANSGDTVWSNASEDGTGRIPGASIFLSIDAPSPGATLYTRKVQINYTALGQDSILYHVEPSFTYEGTRLWQEDSNMNGTLYVQAIPGNITNTVTIRASNAVDTIEQSVSFYCGIDTLRVIFIGDPHVQNDSNHREQIENHIADLESVYPDGWDFLMLAGDQTRFNSNGSSNAGDPGQFAIVRDVFSRNNSFWMRRDRVLPVIGNHERDEELLDRSTNGKYNWTEATDRTYSDFYMKFQGYYIDNRMRNKPHPRTDHGPQEGDDGDIRKSTSYSVEIGNLRLLNLNMDMPSYNVYEASYNAYGSCHWADYCNSTNWFLNEVNNMSDYLLFVQAHCPIWDTVGNNPSEDALSESWESADGTWYVHGEVDEFGTSGIYEKRIDGLDLWGSGHLHQLDGSDEYEYHVWGDNGVVDKQSTVTDYQCHIFRSCYYKKNPDSDNPLATILEFTEGSNNVYVRYRESRCNSVGGNWQGYGIPSPFNWNLSQNFTFNTSLKHRYSHLPRDVDIVEKYGWRRSLKNFTSMGNSRVLLLKDNILIAEFNGNLSLSDINMSNASINYSTDSVGKVVFHTNSSKITNQILYVPVISGSGLVTICPDVDSLSDVYDDAPGSIIVGVNSSSNGYTVSYAKYNERGHYGSGDAYYKITGIRCTGAKETIGGNAPPVAYAGGPYFGHVREPIKFDGSGSYDVDGDIVSYEWHFGDGNIGNDAIMNYSYKREGVFHVQLTVTDDRGKLGTDETWACIDDTPPMLDITKPKYGIFLNDKMILPLFATVILGHVTFEANATDELLGVEKLEFYIDDTLKQTDTNEPYEWHCDETAFGRHTIKVVAYDIAGNVATVEQEVWIFNL